MRHKITVLNAAIAAIAIASAAVPALADDAPAAAPTKQNCFFVTQWRGWKSPSPDVLYLAVNLHDVYRVELSGGSSQLQWPDHYLISKVRGGDSICTALDLDLEVADHQGFKEPLIAKSITKMTPEEVAAIPPRFRP